MQRLFFRLYTIFGVGAAIIVLVAVGSRPNAARPNDPWAASGSQFAAYGDSVATLAIREPQQELAPLLQKEFGYPVLVVPRVAAMATMTKEQANSDETRPWASRVAPRPDADAPAGTSKITGAAASSTGGPPS